MLVPLSFLGGSIEPAHSQRRPSQIRDSAKSAIQHLVLTVEPRHPGREFARGAVGLSIESKELATEDLSASHDSLVTLLRMLGPGVLRIGGGSVDSSWWTSDNEPAPTWATDVITPSDLATLDHFLVATGWKVILGVNLGHFDPTRAASEASVAEHVLGSRLLGFEIGNEPDDYGTSVVQLRPRSYSAGNYLEELAAYGAAMGAAAANINLYGPDLSSQAWLLAIASSKLVTFAAVTQHYYPTTYSLAKGSCRATPVPTALELLSLQVRERENATLQMLVQAGEIAHSKTRISETNTTGSCDTDGGPATSPVYASALWSLDWSLRTASAGVAGLNFHGYLGHCGPYAASPICAESYFAQSKGRVTARPEYYGLLAASQLEGGRFVPTRLSRLSPLGSLPNLTTWATVTPTGIVRIAIDNLATEGLAQLVSIPIFGYTATSETLLGPSVELTTGITLGDMSISTSRQWRPRHVKVTHANHSFHVTVRPASAIIVTLRPKRRRG